MCDKFVVVMFHTVVPNVVWITQGGMGKRERDVEGAVPYMICVVFIQCNIQQVCGFDGRTMFAPTGVVLTPTEKALG